MVEKMRFDVGGVADMGQWVDEMGQGGWNEENKQASA